MSSKKQSEFQRLAKLYPYIYATGNKWGSDGDYIENVMLEAENDKAPANATGKNQDGTWATTDGWPQYAIDELNDYIEGRRGGFTL